MTVRHRAAVLGKPIAHSLSPVIHSAGFAAAGLFDWSYTAVECAEAELPGLIAGLGPEWAGLSVTMPLKEAALAVASSSSRPAAAIGAANTLVRQPDGSWYADNTDAPGMVAVLRDAGVTHGPRVTVLGAGGTARAALAAASVLGATLVTVVARRPAAVTQLQPVADALGVAVRPVAWDAAAAALDTDVVVSTVPKGVADQFAAAVPWAAGSVVFDALYDPWPTRLAVAAEAAGCRVVNGLDLLVGQALVQIELMTGRSVPAATLMAAGRAALASP